MADDSTLPLAMPGMSPSNSREAFAQIKSWISGGRHDDAWRALSNIIRPHDDFTLQTRAARLFRSIPMGALELSPLRVALPAGSTIDPFVGVLSYWLAREGFLLTAHAGEFATARQQMLDRDSALYRFQADVV